MKSNVLKFLRNENGATAIECTLIAADIAVVIAAALQLAGTNVSGIFNIVAGAF